MTQPQGFPHFLFRSWHAGPHCLPALLQGHAVVSHLDLQPHTNEEENDEEDDEDDEEDESFSHSPSSSFSAAAAAAPVPPPPLMIAAMAPCSLCCGIPAPKLPISGHRWIAPLLLGHHTDQHLCTVFCSSSMR